jgi:hypothetical protein
MDKDKLPIKAGDMGDSYRMHDVILPQMTLEEEKEWFY